MLVLCRASSVKKIFHASLMLCLFFSVQGHSFGSVTVRTIDEPTTTRHTESLKLAFYDYDECLAPPWGSSSENIKKKMANIISNAIREHAIEKDFKVFIVSRGNKVTKYHGNKEGYHIVKSLSFDDIDFDVNKVHIIDLSVIGNRPDAKGKAFRAILQKAWEKSRNDPNNARPIVVAAGDKEESDNPFKLVSKVQLRDQVDELAFMEVNWAISADLLSDEDAFNTINTLVAQTTHLYDPTEGADDRRYKKASLEIKTPQNAVFKNEATPDEPYKNINNKPYNELSDEISIYVDQKYKEHLENWQGTELDVYIKESRLVDIKYAFLDSHDPKRKVDRVFERLHAYIIELIAISLEVTQKKIATYLKDIIPEIQLATNEPCE